MIPVDQCPHLVSLCFNFNFILFGTWKLKKDWASLSAVWFWSSVQQTVKHIDFAFLKLWSVFQTFTIDSSLIF